MDPVHTSCEKFCECFAVNHVTRELSISCYLSSGLCTNLNPPQLPQRRLGSALMAQGVQARVLDLSMRESGSLESGWWVGTMWGSWVGCGNFGKTKTSLIS